MKLELRTTPSGLVMRAAIVAGTALGVLACTSTRTAHFEAPGALGPYSAMVRAGELVFVSGKVGARRESFEAEVESAIDALQSDLARIELSLADVVSVTVYVTDTQRYADVNTIYARRFSKPFPARAFVGVAALPGGASFEIQAVARAPR